MQGIKLKLTSPRAKSPTRPLTGSQSSRWTTWQGLSSRVQINKGINISDYGEAREKKLP